MYDRAGEMASTNQEEGEGTLTGNDPFYDRFHWFKLVGRLVSYLHRQSPCDYFRSLVMRVVAFLGSSVKRFLCVSNELA